MANSKTEKLVQGKVNQGELIAKVSEETGFTKNQVKAVLHALHDVSLRELSSRRSVDIKFGTLYPSARAAAVRRNPKTDEPVNVPAKVVPAIHMNQGLKRKLDEAYEGKQANFVN